MTNSTDNTTEKKKAAKKTPKKKGPIRFEGVIPAIIVSALVYAYFALFFDANLRQLIEFSGTQVYGAEVNVAKIDTSVFGGYFQLNGLQITDKEQPSQNLVQIDKIRFELLWDALLRAKFVVNEATIQNIQAYSPRKKPGRIIPPDTKESKALQEVENSVLEQTKEQFNENVLGDVANVIEGADPSSQLNDLQGNLKSDQKIKEIESALNEKKKIWDERLKKLPQKKEIDSLIASSKKLKFDTKNPAQFAKDVKEADRILKEGDKIVNEFDKTSKELKGDVGQFDNSIKSIDQLAKQDLQDLQKRLKIPSLNIADFSKGMFGKMFSEKLGKYKKYMAFAREYMPEKKSAEQKAAKKQELAAQTRAVGRDFRFPKKKGYPIFWLQKASISSEPGASEFSGNVMGSIKNLTSDPVVVGIPTTIDVSGNFPKQQIYGFKANIVVDHTTSTPYEKIDAVIDKFPVSEKSLSNSADVKFALKKAVGKTILKGVSKDEKIHFLVKNQFTSPEYNIAAKSALVQEILTNVANGLPVITVDAAATGKWSNLRWKINSNLGQELSNGFKSQLDKKLKEAREKLNQFIHGKINAEKKKLTSEYSKIKGGIDSQINKQKKQIDQAKKQANNEAKKQKKSLGNDKVKAEAKKAEKKLKNLLGL